MQAKSLLPTAPAQAMALCHEILDSIPPEGSEGSEGCVRAGDAFALMIEYYYAQVRCATASSLCLF